MKGSAMRKYLYAVVALVLAVVVAACGGGKGASSTASNAGLSKPYHELRWGVTDFPGVLDWNRNVQGEMLIVESLAVNNLMEFEADGKVKPGLASSVENPNPTTYVYHLKSVKFSDGKPMTSADVAFSLNRNLYAKEAWDKTYWSDVSSITTRGPSTVIVKLKQPSAVIQDVIAFSGEVIEKAAAEKIGEKALGTPGHMLIGTGPWKLDSYKPEASVELSRNPYWTGARPPAEKVTFTLFKSEAAMALALRSGAIDGVGFYEAPQVFANIPGVRQLKTPGTSIKFISANTTLPPFNDEHVRRALAYATNVKGMIHALFPHGEAVESSSIIPSSLFVNFGAQSQVDEALNALPKYEFNLAKAKQELAKSGYPHGFSTEIDVEQVESASVSCAEVFSADLAKIGIVAKVHEVPAAEQAAVLSSGKSKLAVNTIGAVYADPEGIMSTMLAPSQISPPGSGLNSANYRNAEVDRLMSESIKVNNPSQRLQMISKLLGTVGREAPYWPLYVQLGLGSLSEKYAWHNYSWWTLLWSPWALEVKLTS